MVLVLKVVVSYACVSKLSINHVHHRNIMDASTSRCLRARSHGDDASSTSRVSKLLRDLLRALLERLYVLPARGHLVASTTASCVFNSFR